MRWVHRTLTIEDYVSAPGGYWAYVADDLFTGDFAAIIYWEADDGSWFSPVPLYDEFLGWYLVVYTYEGYIAWKMPLIILGLEVHVAVFESDGSLDTFVASHGNRLPAGWLAP